MWPGPWHGRKLAKGELPQRFLRVPPGSLQKIDDEFVTVVDGKYVVPGPRRADLMTWMMTGGLPADLRKASPWDNMGMSENGVYPQWNSHLVGIMIRKTIGCRGTLFSDKPIWLCLRMWCIQYTLAIAYSYSHVKTREHGWNDDSPVDGMGESQDFGETQDFGPTQDQTWGLNQHFFGFFRGQTIPRPSFMRMTISYIQSLIIILSYLWYFWYLYNYILYLWL